MGATFRNISGSNFVVPELAGYVVPDTQVCDLMDSGLPVFYENFDAAKYVFTTVGCSVKDGLDGGGLEIVELVEPMGGEDL